jgi:hypothetical protein
MIVAIWRTVVGCVICTILVGCDTVIRFLRVRRAIKLGQPTVEMDTLIPLITLSGQYVKDISVELASHARRRQYNGQKSKPPPNPKTELEPNGRVHVRNAKSRFCLGALGTDRDFVRWFVFAPTRHDLLKNVRKNTVVVATF